MQGHLIGTMYKNTMRMIRVLRLSIGAYLTNFPRSSRRAAFVLLGISFAIGSSYPACAQTQLAQPVSTIKEKITDIRAYVLNQGINNIELWGVQILPYGNAPQRLIKNLVARPSMVIVADQGLPNGGDATAYITLSGGRSPTVLVRKTSQENPYMFFSIPAIGQGNSSSVRFFNGVWKEHCQSFVAEADTTTNEDTETSNTSIALFYFLPGEVFPDGSLGEGPRFIFLGQFSSSNHNSDPSIVLSQEFSIPLPNLTVSQNSCPIRR